ncbi:MAG TPA: hypothetical protein VEX18_09635 [Polyangiaceae bacterium]|nr:hypothetical protein [Polyangiaceae bacterium]
MRLRFGELLETERAARERTCDAAKQAWSRLASGDTSAAGAAIAQLDEQLSLVVTSDTQGQPPRAELVVLDSSAWPLAELVLEQAGSDVGHLLSLGRAPRELPLALAAIERAHALDLSRATLRAGFSRGHLLEITLHIPGGNGAKAAQIAAESLVRMLLGDRVFETWVGAVHAVAAPRGGPLRVLDVHAPARAQRAELPLSELCSTVAAAVVGVQRGLPEQSWIERSASAPARASAEWTMLEVEPLPHATGVDKDDLMLASTCTPELLRCYLSGSPCSSRRFSRHGERFVFLSYADAEHSAQKRVARRSQIEAALAERLLGVAAVTGVGLGLGTTYVDLALCNLETGLGRLIAELRCLELPPRSFIQFFDSELSEEWLSISRGSRLTRG